MFEIEFDADAAISALEKQIKRVQDDLPERVPEEMLVWQTYDMKRKYPQVLEQGDSWYTLIYPRSRLSGQRVVRSKPRAGQRKVISRAPGAKRPVLRPDLLTKFYDRISDMLRATETWV